MSLLCAPRLYICFLLFTTDATPNDDGRPPVYVAFSSIEHRSPHPETEFNELLIVNALDSTSTELKR